MWICVYSVNICWRFIYFRIFEKLYGKPCSNIKFHLDPYIFCGLCAYAYIVYKMRISIERLQKYKLPIFVPFKIKIMHYRAHADSQQNRKTLVKYRIFFFSFVRVIIPIFFFGKHPFLCTQASNSHLYHVSNFSPITLVGYSFRFNIFSHISFFFRNKRNR